MLASRMLTECRRSIIMAAAWAGASAARSPALYRRCLHACLDAPLIVVLVAVLFAGAAFAMFGLIRQELTPVEDRSIVHAAHRRAAGRQPRLYDAADARGSRS